MKNKTKSIVAVLTIWTLSFLTLSGVSAYKWDPSLEWPDSSPERHDDMTQAFESNDYEAWKDLMDGKGRVTEVINADNFSQFAEAHNLAESGNIEESKQIRAELGIGLNDWSNKGMWKWLNKRNKSWNGNNGWQWKWNWTWECNLNS